MDPFLDASSHLYKRRCLSARPSVTPSSKSMKNGLLWILDDLDSAGRERKRDEEEGGQGGRSNEEEGATRREKK